MSQLTILRTALSRAFKIQAKHFWGSMFVTIVYLLPYTLEYSIVAIIASSYGKAAAPFPLQIEIGLALLTTLHQFLTLGVFSYFVSTLLGLPARVAHPFSWLSEPRRVQRTKTYMYYVLVSAAISLLIGLIPMKSVNIPLMQDLSVNVTQQNLNILAIGITTFISVLLMLVPYLLILRSDFSIWKSIGVSIRLMFRYLPLVFLSAVTVGILFVIGITMFPYVFFFSLLIITYVYYTLSAMALIILKHNGYMPEVPPPSEETAQQG